MLTTLPLAIGENVLTHVLTHADPLEADYDDGVIW